MTGRQRFRICVRGVVQGVGFRPFVYTCAAALGLTGSVRNDSSGAIIEVEGDASDLDDFLTRLADRAPPLAVIESIETQEIPVAGGTGFVITDTSRSDGGRTLASPDVAMCAECAAEQRDPTTDATGTPSSTARTAARGSRSSRRCHTTAPPPPWPASRCALIAHANTVIPPTGGSMHSRSAARTAGQAFVTGRARAASPMADRRCDTPNSCCVTAACWPSRASVDITWPATPVTSARSPNCAAESGAATSRSRSWWPTCGRTPRRCCRPRVGTAAFGSATPDRADATTGRRTRRRLGCAAQPRSRRHAGLHPAARTAVRAAGRRAGARRVGDDVRQSRWRTDLLHRRRCARTAFTPRRRLADA